MIALKLKKGFRQLVDEAKGRIRTIGLEEAREKGAKVPRKGAKKSRKGAAKKSRRTGAKKSGAR